MKEELATRFASRRISTKAAPAAIGPYSQAIKVGNFVYTSGQIPIDPATGSFAEGGIKEQTMKKETWKTIIQVIVSILTAALTALGTTSCMGHGPFAI